MTQEKILVAAVECKGFIYLFITVTTTVYICNLKKKIPTRQNRDFLVIPARKDLLENNYQEKDIDFKMEVLD